MPRKSYSNESQNEEVRFQLSLLNLLYRNAATQRQVMELEGLLSTPTNLAPSR